jgi:hypothetical protein
MRTLSLLLALAGLATAAAATPPRALGTDPAPADVTHVDAGLTVDGEVLDVGVDDVDGRPGPELSVALYDRAAGRRELLVFGLSAQGGRTPEPVLTIPIKSDVLAWCWAEVRPEPGKELVLLTRSGAWAYAPGGDGYRDILRIVSSDLLYDVADPNELPRWPYVLPGERQDALLLPDPEGYTIWRPGGEGGAYLRSEHYDEDLSESRGNRDGGVGVVVASGEIRFSADMGDHLAVGSRPEMPEAHLVRAEAQLDAPAMLDVDGDGRLDLMRWKGGSLQLFMADAQGLPTEPTREESWAPAMSEGGNLNALFTDLDGDGDLDVLARMKGDKEEQFESNRDMTLFVLINDGERLLPEKPLQLFKFEAAALEAQVTDVDGDGVTDLVVKKLLGPSLLALTSPEGLKVTRSVLVFFGEGGGRFEKRPSLEYEDTYDAASLGSAISSRMLSLDLDGDGQADLVDTDLRGNTVVHRTRLESSFFGGDTWDIEHTPWRRFEGLADMNTMQVMDVNDDGLGDLLSHKGRRLTLLLSRRTGGGR